MKKANKNYRREMLAAEQRRKAERKRYPLNHESDGITLYSNANVDVRCSSNLFIPDGMADLFDDTF